MFAHDFDRRWQAIKRRCAALDACAARLGLETSWGRGNPFDHAAPPADEAEVRLVERALGRGLPPSLRWFFLHASAKVEFGWSLPGRNVFAPEGYHDFIYDLVPPPPFQEVRNMGGLEPVQKIGPRIGSGGISIALDQIVPLSSEAEGWARHFDRRARVATDEIARISGRQFAQMWRRAVPFAEVGDGDLIAVDGGDPAEPVIVTNHDGADYPAFSYGRPLLDHLDHVSRLGFVWHSRLFADVAACRALEARSEVERPYEASLGLRLVEAGVIDADGANARLWRDWLGWPKD